MRQTVLFEFSNQISITCPAENLWQKPKRTDTSSSSRSNGKGRGRPTTRITQNELEEILQGLVNPAQRQLIQRKYPAWLVKTAMRIYTVDYGKQGIINRKGVCPRHGKTFLTYRFNPKDGARITCLECGFTTHYELMLFHSEGFELTPVQPQEE